MTTLKILTLTLNPSVILVKNKICIFTNNTADKNTKRFGL